MKISLTLAVIVLAALVANPASSSAQPAPPTPPVPPTTPGPPAGPTLRLGDVPPGFVPAPPFLSRYSGTRGPFEGASAEYVRGDEYVASVVQRRPSARAAWEAFPSTLVPGRAYYPRWLDPPAIGEEATLFALTDWVSSGPLYGYEVKWRRGSFLGTVTVLGVSDEPDVAISLADLLDAQTAAEDAGGYLPPEENKVEQIAREVQELRGLSGRGRVQFSMLAPGYAGSLLWRLRLNSWPPDLTGARVLDSSDHHAVDVSLELDLGILRLLGQQVDLAKLRAPGPSLAGVYSTRNQIGLVSGSWPLGWREQIVTAHEFAHSMQDQHFGLDALTDQLLATSVDGNTDRVLALSALLNGEAELTARLWGEQYLEPGSWEALKAEGEQFDGRVGIPALWWAEVRFPYWVGERFVTSFYEDGGWAEVNALFARPPVSSEQVLHPDLYVGDAQPVQVRAPSTAGVAARGWLPVLEETFGEIGLRAILAPFVEPERAASAAAGWGGDRYVVVGSRTESLFGPSGYPIALVLDSVWDSPAEASEFFDALADSLDVRFTGAAQRRVEGVGRLSWSTADFQVITELHEDWVRFALAPDRAGLMALAPPGL